MGFGGGRREAVLFVLLFLPWASVPELREDVPAGRQGSPHPLPSLLQRHEPIMTILQVFQMEGSDFSVLMLGTALPLLMINPHHLLHQRLRASPQACATAHLWHRNGVSWWLEHICALQRAGHLVPMAVLQAWSSGKNNAMLSLPFSCRAAL